jgi:hypothetical protein
MFGWLKLEHKLIALAALMSLAQIASAFSTFVLVRRQVEAETLATATKMASSWSRHDFARGIHSARGGNGPDRPAGRMGC